MLKQNEYISAWETKAVTLLSPDGKHSAVVENLAEFGMGSPTSGRLILSDGTVLNSCSPSIAWSSDSRYLAVPQYTEQGFQQLLVVDVIAHRTGYVEKPFKILQIHAFSNGVIIGVNSPATFASRVEVSLDQVCWEQ